MSDLTSLLKRYLLVTVQMYFLTLGEINEKAIAELSHRANNGACLRGPPQNGFVVVSGACA